MNVILFDGVCNLCNSTVNFIIDRDKKNEFKFASLQSPYGQSIMDKFGLEKQYLSTIVLLEDETISLRAVAALRILKRLRGIYSLAFIFIVIPTPILDFFYNIVAKNRYAWFGKRETCRVPEPWLKEKFIE